MPQPENVENEDKAGGLDVDKTNVPTHLRGSKRKITTACIACKQRKRKCSGGPPPCEDCAKRKTECIFDEELDQRRRFVAKRKQEESDYYRDVLAGLLETLRLSRSTHLSRLVGLIRNNATLDEISAFVKDVLEGLRHDGLESSPESQELESVQRELSEGPQESARRRRRKIESLESLCDVPLHQVPAAPWTNVTNNDDLVSHLISLYYTWEHPFCNYIEKETFLADMKAGRSRFCSSLLHYSGRLEGNGRPGGSELGGLFSAEAKRLWHLEDGRASLTTIQALLVISSTRNAQGEDKAGWMYLHIATQMYLDMRLHRNLSTPLGKGPETSVDNTLLRIQAVLAWGAFTWQTVNSLNFSREPALREAPEIDIPCAVQDSPKEMDEWLPYPIQRPPQPCYLWETFWANSTLNDIINNISWLLYKDSENAKPISTEQVAELYSKLCSWLDGLPDVLGPEANPLPHIILVHLHFHNAVTTLFKQYVHPAEPDADMPSIDEADTIYSHSVAEMRNLLGLYRIRLGWKCAPPYAIQMLSTVSFDDMARLDEPSSRASFIACVSDLRELSNSWFMAKAVLRTIQLFAEKSNIELPTELLDVFDVFRDENWKTEEVGQIRSQYRVNMGSLTEESDENLLETLLNFWEGSDLSIM